MNVWQVIVAALFVFMSAAQAYSLLFDPDATPQQRTLIGAVLIIVWGTIVVSLHRGGFW